MQEIWKDIPNYEEMYQVSNYGRVKSLKYNKEKILKPCVDRYGYLYVKLCKNGKGKSHTIHRLVLKTFAPVDNMDKLDVNHRNEIKSENYLWNLEWCDRAYNNNYGFKNMKSSCTQGKPIAMLEPETHKFIKSFCSSYEAGRQTGFCYRAINYCCNNKYDGKYPNIYKGYMWVYLEEYINNPYYPITT